MRADLCISFNLISKTQSCVPLQYYRRKILVTIACDEFAVRHSGSVLIISKKLEATV